MRKTSGKDVQEAIHALLAKGVPPLGDINKKTIVRLVFLPDAVPGRVHGVNILNAHAVLNAL